jgi:hypothetical protein
MSLAECRGAVANKLDCLLKFFFGLV